MQGVVTVHAHAPGLNFSGNVITWNWIGRNNVRTDTHDLKATGIYLADASPLTIKVTGNTIYNNYYGIFTAGQVTVKVAALMPAIFGVGAALDTNTQTFAPCGTIAMRE